MPSGSEKGRSHFITWFVKYCTEVPGKFAREGMSGSVKFRSESLSNAENADIILQEVSCLKGI